MNVNDIHEVAPTTYFLYKVRVNLSSCSVATKNTMNSYLLIACVLCTVWISVDGYVSGPVLILTRPTRHNSDSMSFDRQDFNREVSQRSSGSEQDQSETSRSRMSGTSRDYPSSLKIQRDSQRDSMGSRSGHTSRDYDDRPVWN